MTTTAESWTDCVRGADGHRREVLPRRRGVTLGFASLPFAGPFRLTDRNIVQDTGHRVAVAVSEFDTKVAVVVRDNLVAWQR